MFVFNALMRAIAAGRGAFGRDDAGSRRVGEGRPTDGEISRAVVIALEGNSRVPEGKVWVAVCDGWVTLKGEVTREDERAIAARIAGDLLGVRGVTNSLTLCGQIAARLHDGRES